MDAELEAMSPGEFATYVDEVASIVEDYGDYRPTEQRMLTALMYAEGLQAENGRLAAKVDALKEVRSAAVDFMRELERHRNNPNATPAWMLLSPQRHRFWDALNSCDNPTTANPADEDATVSAAAGEGVGYYVALFPERQATISVFDDIPHIPQGVEVYGPFTTLVAAEWCMRTMTTR